MNNSVVVAFIMLYCAVTLVFPVDCNAGKAQKTTSSPITILLSRATSLMNEGKTREAFDMLEPFEHDLAGNTDYDYLFGVASLESGYPVKASLSLERVLAVKPGFAGARVDLGRAYFDIGNYLRARQEFTLVLKHPNPPPLVKTAVSSYMTMIDERLAEKKNKLSGWVEISGGYDSNVNYSTDDGIVEVPVLQSAAITLDDDNIEQDDTFLEVKVNMGLLHRFTPGLRSYVGLDGSKRLMAQENQFETEDAGLRSWLELGRHANTFRIGANARVSTLDKSLNSQQVGGSMEWRHTVNASNIMTLFGQYDTFRYPDVESNDFNRWVGGVSFLHALPFLRQSMVAASAYGGVASETNHRADGDNSIYGLRLGYQMKPVSNVSIVAGVGEQVSGFKRENAVFQEKRDDQLLDASLSLNWSPVRRVSMGCEFSYIHNNSNIPIYEYKRNEVSATVRYYFF